MNKLKEWAKNLKSNISLLYYCYLDKKTPWYAKALIILTISYAMSPIDLIPDFIPVLGYLDDLLLIPLGIALSYKLIPKEIIEENKTKANDISFKDLKSKGIYGAILIAAIWIIILYIIITKLNLHI